MGMKSELRRRLSKTEGRLRREGRRLASVFLCGALIVGNLSAVPVSVLADDDNDYTYEIEKTALQAALQTAVSEGNTVSEELEFAGEHAEEYAELLEADGTLYELELSEEEIDEDDDRDKALDLRIFARIEGDIPVDEAYEIDGSEEIVFLLSNKTEKTATATISVDGLETDVITILPVDSIAVEEESTAVENTAVSTAVSSGVSIGGSGSGGSGGSAGGSAAKTEKVDSTEEDLVIEITESADNDVTEAEPIVEDSSVSILNEDDSKGSISAVVSDDTVSGQEEADGGSSDDKAEEDQTGDSETGDTGIENANSEDAADEDTNADDTEEAAGDTEGNDSEIGDTGSKEEADSSSDTSDADDTSDAGSGDDEGAGDASDNDSGSDITEDSDVSVLGSAISIHNSILLAAGMATDSDADEEASASDADNAVDGIVYESVRFDKKGAAAFATTATDLKLDEVDTTESTETVEYIAESDSVAVTVVAPVGALPNGAELSVTLYEEDSDEYTAAAEAINYNADETAEAISNEETIETASEEIADETSTGLAVLDISFYVDGEEVEPTETVSVSINASGILPEDADASTIEVQHLAETENGIEPTLVADITEETDGTVDEENAVVEFEVESFSSFTITWSYYNDWGQATNYKADMEATAYLFDTESEISGASGTISVKSGESVSLTSENDDLAIDGYVLESATIKDGDNIVGATSVTITITQEGYLWNRTTYYTCTYKASGDGAEKILYENQTSQTAKISLYYKVLPAVTITSTKTDAGYLLKAIPSNFTDMENIDYNWSVESDKAEIENNEDGTATLTWKDGENAWKINESDGVSAIVSVTATSTYENENEEKVTETASGSLKVSSELIAIYVFVSGFVQGSNPAEYFSDDMLELLQVNTLDGSGYFAAGVIYLDMSQFSSSSTTSRITTEKEWDYVVNVIKESLDTSYSETCPDNLIAQYANQIMKDIGYTQGQGYSGLWLATTHSNLKDAGGEVNGKYWHLDIRFETVKITYVYGNNGIEDSGTANDGYEAGSKVFIKGAVMDYEPEITVPEGYKLAGYYEDEDFTTLWTGYKEPLNEDDVVYIRLVPENEMVLYYRVAVGEGKLTSYSEGVKESADTAVGSTANAADGWVFDGWYYDLECTQKITDDVEGTKLTPTKPIDGWVDGTTYYAKFVPISYDIELRKVDSADSNTTLSGAYFILSRTNTTTDEDGDKAKETTYYSCNNETVTWEGFVDDATAIITDKGGMETLYSLTTGYTYTLTETVAPDGYNLLSNSITFKISDGIVTEAAYGDNSLTGVVSVGNDGKTIIVTNTAGKELPETGGPGTTPFRIAGLLLTSCSAYLIYETLKRRRNYLK